MGALMDATPLSVHLPFNRECLAHTFTPAKIGGAPPTERRGLWLIVQDQRLVVQRENGELRPPRGAPPDDLEKLLGEPMWLGTYEDEPCWAVRLASEVALPASLRTE